MRNKKIKNLKKNKKKKKKMNEDIINEVSVPIIVSYNQIKEKTSLEFLFDYSKILIKEKLFDPQILYWQI